MRGVGIVTPLSENARDLEAELAWLASIVEVRFKHYFATTDAQVGSSADIVSLAPPEFGDSASPYASFLRLHSLGLIERMALALALAPHLRPQMLDIFYTKNPHIDRRFAELGGARHGPDGEFFPTGETLAFLLGGSDLEVRFLVQEKLSAESLLSRHDVVRLATLGDELPIKAPLCISQEYLSLFTTGAPRRPDFGPHFPARHIQTDLDWSDLVLHPGVRKQLEEIETWLAHGSTLLSEWGMARKLRPGYRCLFYGPPGVGKTITACLLGKATGRDVYKVDLSLVVSKYIGETEKNLGRIFDQAQHKNWILFFDEADALFGKRGEAKDASDRFANQEVSFLLQRIEVFDGVAILASNLRDNLDSAFMRRFESVIYFPVPRPEERLRLWQNGFSEKCDLDPALDLQKIAKDHELSGGSIMNVIRFASLQALKEGRVRIAADDIAQGINREYSKERKKAS